MANVLVYELDGKIYINLTNKCTNDCIFCLRKDKDDVKGQTLWLDDENCTAQDVIAQFEEILRQKPDNDNSEVIFCGYGEPLLKLDVLKEVAKYIKEKYPQTKIRINTNGHANYVYKRDIVPELKGLIDTISVSLNGESSSEYDELSQPVFEGAYDEVKKFIKSCADNGFETVASVVEGYKGRHLNLNKCEQIATDLGAKFRVREWIKNGY
ncbi:TatD family nuclease-associated radical SAM protein [bacterium]|nr:TatD family nuclease-associated radical SAM protein [bacterium]